jgi:hypothetical protein
MAASSVNDSRDLAVCATKHAALVEIINDFQGNQK